MPCRPCHPAWVASPSWSPAAPPSTGTRAGGGPVAGAQSYSLHALEDLYHTPGYPAPPPYPFTPFTTMSNDLPPKAVPLAPDEGADASAPQDPSPWTKEDGNMVWGSYECRRAYWGGCQRTSTLLFYFLTWILCATDGFCCGIPLRTGLSR